MASLGQELVLYVGPIFIGSLFNWALYGILVLQTYLYWSYHFTDPLWMRALVVSTLLLDTLQIVFTTQVGWELLVLGYGNPLELINPPWTAYSLPIFCGLVGAMTQIFFAWRMYSLRRTTTFLGIAILIAAIALMQCVTAFVNGIQWGILGVVKGPVEEKAAAYVFLVGAAAADVLIALAMTFVLHSRKSPDMLPRTNQLLDKLISQVIHSGAITAVVAIVELVCFHLKPQTYLHICFLFFLGKLYSNVLMANINSRRRPSHSATNSRAYYDTNESIGNNLNVHITSFRRTDRDLEMKARNGAKDLDHIPI